MQNLWPEFTDEQPLSESTRRAQKQTISLRRRPREDAIMSTLREWLLYDYIASFCRLLAATRIFSRCYWVDGLGGSPILQPALSISQGLTRENKPISLHYIALESKSSKRKEANVVSSITLPKESGLVSAGWLEAASILLQAIDQSAAIFLLNPFGNSGVFSIEDLAPLYQRTAPTELCLLIAHKQVETRLLPHLLTPDGATAFTVLLHSDQWKALLAESVDMAQKIHGLIDAFLTSIQRQHFLTVQRISLHMHTAPAVVEPIPYTLIFASRRQDSLVSMNDAVCSHRRRLHEQSLQGVLAEEWFAAQERERQAEEMQQVCQRLLHLGRTQRQRRWPDLRQQMLIANFGQFTLHDYDMMIQKLIQNGEVRCEWRQKHVEHPGREDFRIPGNEDLLLWSEKRHY